MKDTIEATKLDEALKDAQSRFDTLVTKKNSTQSELNEIETELVKIQGEYRALQALRESNEEPSVKVKGEDSGRRKV